MSKLRHRVQWLWPAGWRPRGRGNVAEPGTVAGRTHAADVALTGSRMDTEGRWLRGR